MRSFVNSLFSSEGTIPDFLESGSLNDETRLVLLNALHFQALWKVPFNPKMTVERMFHCANRSTIPVQMMRLTNHFNYGRSKLQQVHSLLLTHSLYIFSIDMYVELVIP